MLSAEYFTKFYSINFWKKSLMGKIFNKPYSYLKKDTIGLVYDGYESELNDWEASFDDELKALAINLRHDYRVSVDREIHFRDMFENCGRLLRKALDKYYEKFVDCSNLTNQPDFCHSDNLIANCSSGTCCEGFSFDDDFVTVMNLNGLMERLKDAQHNLSVILPLWENLKTLGINTKLHNPILFADWLDKRFMDSGKLKKGDHPDVLQVVYGFFELLRHDLAERPNFHKYPIWVTRWSLFEQVAFATRHNGNDYIDRWNQVIGVNRKFPTWQIIVKYPTNVVKSLYRPSQLDGNYYPQHFPPPPLSPDSKFPFANGGHTVDLASKNSNLLPEYLHQPIALEPEYYQMKIGKARITNYRVKKPRGKHYLNLSNNYFDNPADIQIWMPTPI